jgi:transposase
MEKAFACIVPYMNEYRPVWSGIDTGKGENTVKLHQTQTEFNCGIDLHARSMYICVMDREGNKLVHRNVRDNDFDHFLKLVEPYRDDLTVACECTFNWYWLCDACEAAGIHFVLGHALYMKAIHGTKTKNDKVDSEKIAHLLRSNMLPEAYCCRAERRPIRDLLRRRIWLVRLRATVEGRMSASVQVHGQAPLTRQEKRRGTRHLDAPKRHRDPILQMALESDSQISHFLHGQILDLENAILRNTRLLASTQYNQLKTLPGFGKILPLVVLYEVDDISRFPTARDFCSYAMLAPPGSESAGKIVGVQGRRIGNHYLKWAFMQAVTVAKRQGPFKRYADRLQNRHGKRRANAILAHQLGIAVYHMLRNGTVFDIKRFCKGRVNLKPADQGVDSDAARRPDRAARSHRDRSDELSGPILASPAAPADNSRTSEPPSALPEAEARNQEQTPHA